jgi:hypothetical protein
VVRHGPGRSSRRRRGGGLIIDGTQSGPSVVRRSTDIPYGYVVVLPKDGGEVQIHIKDAPKDAAERLLTAFLESGMATVQDVTNIAGDLVSSTKG